MSKLFFAFTKGSIKQSLFSQISRAVFLLKIFNMKKRYMQSSKNLERREIARDSNKPKDDIASVLEGIVSNRVRNRVI